MVWNCDYGFFDFYPKNPSGWPKMGPNLALPLRLSRKAILYNMTDYGNFPFGFRM